MKGIAFDNLRRPSNLCAQPLLKDAESGFESRHRYQSGSVPLNIGWLNKNQFTPWNRCSANGIVAELTREA